MDRDDIKLSIKLFELFSDYYTDMARYECDFEREIFDFTTVKIMTLILANSYFNESEGKGFQAKISRVEMVRKFRKTVSSGVIRKRLKILARYWFIQSS